MYGLPDVPPDPPPGLGRSSFRVWLYRLPSIAYRPNTCFDFCTDKNKHCCIRRSMVECNRYIYHTKRCILWIYSILFFGELLMTFLIAMVPVLELRGAIPAGIAAGLPPAAAAARPPSSAILRSNPLSSFFCSAVFLTGCANPAGLDRKSTGWSAGHTSKGRIVKKYRTIGLIILVAIPLPGPGPGPAPWWPMCWTSGSGQPSPPSRLASSSPESLPPP